MHAVRRAGEPDAGHKPGTVGDASRALAVVPGTGGYQDNVKWVAAFKAAHPDAEVTCEKPPAWVGKVTVGGVRKTATRNDLGLLLDALDAMAAEGAQ